MKNLKILALALLVAMGAAAQKPMKGKGGVEKRAKKSADWISEQVKLTPEQYTKVYNIQFESMTKLVVIKRDTAMAKDQAKVQMKAIRKSAVTQIQGVLTPDQFQILKVKLKEKHELKKANKGEKPAKKSGIDKEMEDELLN